MQTLKLKILFTLISFILLPGCSLKNYEGPRVVDLQNGICQDTATGVMWQKIKSEKVTSIEDARTYAKNQRIGGYDDWRLPTVYELYSLLYLRDLHIESQCEMNLEGNFWSDEKDGEGLVGAWKIGDQCDPVRQYAPASAGFVRVVRP